ncbi:integrase [Ancylobacter sp. 3268]|uniref:site-specific integrase n=1 Tax=Ancylobacter sp. 3268 TaxID=2817752 RepID=UPI0028619497|nr:site-specific integrase [Ancylobacter sp. 3268]MDR6954064.1 integrase [Ancylobacter sp. 3268]
MGTIVARKRKDGTTGYTAQIVRKQKGAIVYREAKTFDREQAAKAWLRKRESELDMPGGIQRAEKHDVTLGDAIDRYIAESSKGIGRTKAQVLKAIKEHDIANMKCSTIGSDDIVAFAQGLANDRLPQTVGNYISHLAAVFAIAQPAWRYDLSQSAMKDAHVVLRRLGTTSKSEKRERRPTLPELDLVMQHFVERQARAPSSAPMHRIIAFALYSTRRMDEISRIRWDDLDITHSRVIVRDMKHPGQKVGNDVRVDLPPEALQIILAMPRTKPAIFPYTPDAIGAAFTRAGHTLGIDDLHFHDLRHEGVSRLFEMGWTIPQAASVSGHRSWQSLQRYTHIRESGDKYAGWKWLPIVTSPMEKPT